MSEKIKKKKKMERQKSGYRKKSGKDLRYMVNSLQVKKLISINWANLLETASNGLHKEIMAGALKYIIVMHILQNLGNLL